MSQEQSGQKPKETQEKAASDSVLADKEKFGEKRADEELKHMGEKTKEAAKQK